MARYKKKHKCIWRVFDIYEEWFKGKKITWYVHRCIADLDCKNLVYADEPCEN